MSYDPTSTRRRARARPRAPRADASGGLFTSDLSVNEFLLVKQAGFDPLGLVIGSSIYHIGFQQSSWNQNEEMDVLSQAMYHARELAMTRMEEEADQLGADGIVGVRLDVGRYEWGAEPGRVHRHRHRGQAPRRRAAPRAERPAVHERPLRPGLLDAAARRLPPGRDGDGHLRLPRRPPGAARLRSRRSARTSRCRTSPRRSTTRASWRWSGCRTRPRRLQAEGIVGVQLQERTHGWGSHVIEFFAVGTAIVPTSAEHVIDAPAMMLSMDG